MSIDIKAPYKKILIDNLLKAGEKEALVTILKKMPIIEVADFISRQSADDIIDLLKHFTIQEQALILADFKEGLQQKIFEKMDTKTFAQIFTEMPSDERAEFYRDLDEESQVKLLPFLDKKVKENVISLSSYPEETVGGNMNTDFATVNENMTAEEAIEKVRSDAPSKKMIYYIYVVDEDMMMKGFVTIKDLIMAPKDMKVRDMLHDDYVFAKVDDDKEEAATTIAKYDLIALPVLNSRGQLIGIIDHDIAADIIRDEDTEDLQKFMGIMPGKEVFDYNESTVFQQFKKRVVWVVSLAAIGIISGVIIHSYESALEALLILALYMPMVADTGGNAGSQAATVVVRALALGQITIGNWFKILFKEARVGSMLAVCLGTVAFLKVLFLSWETEIPEGYSLMLIAFVISLALSLQVISSTIIGGGLPLLVKKFGGDPAVAASPAITTAVDITGLLIYFSVATFFLL